MSFEKKKKELLRKLALEQSKFRIEHNKQQVKQKKLAKKRVEINELKKLQSSIKGLKKSRQPHLSQANKEKISKIKARGVKVGGAVGRGFMAGFGNLVDNINADIQRANKKKRR